MGVYIKGMEMPRSCSECFVRPCDGRAKNKRVMVQRGQDCPLVTLPPHGRLIDADAMFKDICDGINAMTAIGIAVDGQWLWDKLNDALENAPTVIEAEEGE